MALCSTERSRSAVRLYDKDYFQGSGAKSHYDDYVTQALGPSRHLAETLFLLFRPATALDMGCAVGHAVKRLRELRVEAWGYDISHWAVQHAGVPFVKILDFSTRKIERKFDLIFCYDVIEHVPMDRLEFAIRNLWDACAKDLIIVPALYPDGTIMDPNEPTHEIFHGYDWWLSFIINCGCKIDREMSSRLAKEEHSKLFNYDDRIFVFSRLGEPA